MIVVDAVGNGIDQLDDELCAPIARGCFCTEDKGMRDRVIRRIFDNFVIERHHVQDV